MDNTVKKALTLLETLSLAPQPARVTHLAEALGLSKSSVHRLLQILQDAGYVHQPNGGTRYAATLRLWKFGVRVVSRLEVVAAAQPAMRCLADRTGATIYLARFDATEVTYLDRVTGSYLSAHTEIGDHAPVHCTATGKALLAWQTSSLINGIIGGPLHAFTRKTITNAADLRAHLARVRAEGFAVQLAEWHLSEYAVAAPIFDREGDIVAAIGLSEASVPDAQAAVDRVAPAVVAAARAVSQRLADAPGPFLG